VAYCPNGPAARVPLRLPDRRRATPDKRRNSNDHNTLQTSALVRCSAVPERHGTFYCVPR